MLQMNLLLCKVFDGGFRLILYKFIDQSRYFQDRRPFAQFFTVGNLLYGRIVLTFPGNSAMPIAEIKPETYMLGVPGRIYLGSSLVL